VLAAKGPLDRAAVVPYDEKRDPTILAALTSVRDDEQVRKEFSLDRDTDLRIYALGEGSGGDMVDFGWIEDAKSRRRVWEMTYAATEHAGGAKKNRKFEGVIRLPAGITSFATRPTARTRSATGMRRRLTTRRRGESRCTENNW